MEGEESGEVFLFLLNKLNSALLGGQMLLLTQIQVVRFLFLFRVTFQRFGWKDGGQLWESFSNNLTHIVSGILERLVLDPWRDCAHTHRHR